MNPKSISDTIIQGIGIKGSAERIFEALTDPGQRVKWWGAKGRFQTTHMVSDLRIGGKWMMRGVGMGGRPFTVGGEYRQIERPPDCSCIPGFPTGKRMRPRQLSALIWRRKKMASRPSV
jgi:uncharacterized protein YndB with AHSA1/START domain